jgi:hypothetical protein
MGFTGLFVLFGFGILAAAKILFNSLLFCVKGFSVSIIELPFSLFFSFRFSDNWELGDFKSAVLNLNFYFLYFNVYLKHSACFPSLI